MKSKKIQLLEIILRFMAKSVLTKYKPIVVGITGSVGKTSTKEAVYTVLSAKYLVRKTEKNYNNEIGIPLTIIGAESGGRSFLKWMKVLWQWFTLLVFRKEYPKVLIIELGVDHPGDMEYLMTFVRPDIGIVTNVSWSHYANFNSIERIAKEKGRLIEALPENGFAILNIDDENIKQMSQRTKAQIITTGFDQDAKVNASDFSYANSDGYPNGITFKLNHDATSMPFRLKHILGSHQVYAVLAAVACGLALKVNLVDAAKAMENFITLPGRLNLIGGIKGSYIMDDTYNASPVSTVAALEVLSAISSERKIAVLGDMLELGEQEKNGHEIVAQKAFETEVDYFFAVGKRMETAVQYLMDKGFPKERIYQFDNPDAAGERLKDIIESKDVVLVKGSQGMRMEKVVELVMESPLDAEELLCRQNLEWKNKPFVSP